MLRPTLRIVLAGAVSCVVAGCGLATHHSSSTVAVVVTQDFGARGVAKTAHVKPGSSSTAVSVLQSQQSVTRSTDGAVASIGGLTAPSGSEWFQYVNGVQATTQTTATPVGAGDRVWWDLHASDAAGTSPAVVGSFPEPFLDGIGGKRLPVTLECAPDVTAACHVVAKGMSGVGIPVALQGLGTGSGQDTLGIVVGVWSDLTGQLDAHLVSLGPSASGVYARFASRGAQIELLNDRGNVAQRVGAGSGLIAATRDTQDQPTWLITGTDAAGVLAAAQALTARRLHLHFALVVSGGRDIAVPLK